MTDRPRPDREPGTPVLIVEDSPTQAHQLRHILEQHGFEVLHAANGRLALDAARKRKPALVISDVMMPEMDGYELCRTLKHDALLGDIPVILVTSLSDPEDVIHGLECRADHFVLKPYDARHLLGRVAFVLANREMGRRERSTPPVEIDFNGRRHVITADRLQVLNLLLSTYEAAIQRNRQLTSAQDSIRRAETFLSSIIENVPSAIVVRDAHDMRLQRVNRAFEELFGYARTDVVGKTFHEFAPTVVADSYATGDREALLGGALIEVPEMRLPAGARGERVVRTIKVPILDGYGVPQYLLGISEDVTERRAWEEALAAAKLEAERANRAKSEFLSRMSHDLRTPLNGILGFAQLLELDPLSDDQRDSVRHIISGGSHLLALINEILDITKIESGRLSLSPEPVRLNDVVGDLVDLVRPLAAQRNVTVDASAVMRDGELRVIADRQRLRQILLNLLSNAIKYNRTAGRVWLTCEALVDGRLRISVRDSGAGIRPEQVPLLFQPFERLGAERTAIEGTGLGLVLSKGLAEAMGGTMGVESVVDQGSTFWVELAQATSHDAIQRPTRPPRTASAADTGVSGTVLYIEDNLSNFELMERVLERRPGVRLIGASHGQEGIDLVRAEAPDLVLLDLHLPDMRGEEVLRRLWEDIRTRTIPVAILSADATASQTARMRAAGAAAYLTKPIDVGNVLELIDRVLKKEARP
jgi:PAS domain S-box-containing protein